jgi:hypothetical protein
VGQPGRFSFDRLALKPSGKTMTKVQLRDPQQDLKERRYESPDNSSSIY